MANFISMLAAAAVIHLPSFAGTLSSTLPSPPPLDARASRAVEQWERVFRDNVRERSHRSASALMGRGGTLRRMAILDQSARAGLDVLDAEDLSQRERQAAQIAIWTKIVKIDDQNTLVLIDTLSKRRGWFRNSSDGVQQSEDAWLIVQHTRNLNFMKRVLVLMRPLRGTKELDGRNYALLYDRVHIFSGREQEYGSQVSCFHGRIDFFPIRDRSLVNRKRRAVGYRETIAETGKRLSVGAAC